MIAIPPVAQVLPHRTPMLLLDEFIEVTPGVSITATWTVDPESPWFADVGPQVLPSTLLLESWCQSVAALAAWDDPNPDVLSGSVMLFGSVRDVEFGPAVAPGDTIEYRAGVDRIVDDTLLASGNAVSAGNRVLTVGQVTIALRPAETLRRS